LMIGVAVWIIAPVIPHVISQAPESFVVVKNMSELDHQLALAKQQKKQVILDFYADWCKSCLIMDRHVFAKPEIKTALTEFVLLRVDMTKHNQFDSEIQERFNVIAPPTILFFSANGEELHAYQVVGEVNAKEFLADLKQIRNDFCKTNTQYC
jgi:thiol:disulfide interchange protein DsbD